MNGPTRDRWSKLWRVAQAKVEPVSWYERLAALYTGAERHYHNFQHILECLNEFDLARHLARDPAAVEIAIWFHDAIYDSRAKDNEEKSAELARQCLDEMGLKDNYGEKVTMLILATKHLAPASGQDTDTDIALLTDIDLSILGQPSARFQEYETQIRAEYAWVAKILFRIGRGKILKEFLSRDRIYVTDFFFRKYEEQARRNIEKSIRSAG